MLGRYQLLAQVGRGGMGVVWLARLRGARGFNRLVAVKTLVSEVTDRTRFEDMMLEEARIASLIHHPNVVQTLELGEDNGLLYLVMEWVSGESLRYLMKELEGKRTVPLRIAVNLVAQALRGLHAAHELRDQNGAELGVVHRDVSPQNLIVTLQGELKLLDFGIAKATNEESSDTATGEVKGKYAYMAPEQVLGQAVDRRSDLFAVAIILYELTTGRHPFRRETSAGTINGLVSDEPIAQPSSVSPGFPLELERVLMRALEKDPERRFATAEDFRRELEEALPSQNPEATELEVRRFLNRAMGARERERRAAVHQAQLAGDEKDPRPERGPRVESGTSLRAISIDEEEDEDRTQRERPMPLARPKLVRAPEPSSSRRGLPYALIAGLIVAASVAALVLRAPVSISWTKATATQPAAAVGSPVPSLTSPAPPAPPSAAPSASAPAVASSAPQVIDDLPSDPPAPKRSTTTTRRTPAKVTRPAPKRSSKRAAHDDLIAPEYAR